MEGGKNGHPYKLSSGKGQNLLGGYRCVSQIQGWEVHPARTQGRKGAVRGKSWDCCFFASPSVFLSVLSLEWTMWLCPGLSTCQSVSVYRSFSFPEPLEPRMSLLFSIFLENHTLPSFLIHLGHALSCCSTFCAILTLSSTWGVCLGYSCAWSTAHPSLCIHQGLA